MHAQLLTRGNADSTEQAELFESMRPVFLLEVDASELVTCQLFSINQSIILSINKFLGWPNQ